MIEFKNVSKTYPTSTEEAVHDANFNIKKGEFAFLVGSSGCPAITSADNDLVSRYSSPSGCL